MLKFQDFCCLSWAENGSRLIFETSAFYRSDVDRIIDGLRVGKKREFFDQPKPFLAYEFKSLQFKFPYLRWLLNTQAAILLPWQNWLFLFRRIYLSVKMAIFFKKRSWYIDAEKETHIFPCLKVKQGSFWVVCWGKM